MSEVIQYNLEYKSSLIGHLGITFQHSDQDSIVASMPVDHRTCQPFGCLCGGASLALAEVIAGHGSRLLCQENQRPYGIQVSGNHLVAVPKGSVVIGKGQLEHQGKGIHVWSVDIYNQDVKVSVVRVVNRIVHKV